jgi:hypothetical protein
MFAIAVRRSRNPLILALLTGLLALVATQPGRALTFPVHGYYWDYKKSGLLLKAQQHDLDTLNRYRAQAGAAPLQCDTGMNIFAVAGSTELSRDHKPHKHNTDAYVPYDGKTGKYWEVQGDAKGWPIVGWPNSPNLDATVDNILASMMAEPLPPPNPPGFNHHSIIIDRRHTKVGIGLIVDANKGLLYLTNDFNP